jgi:predicted nucleotidyltransferase
VDIESAIREITATIRDGCEPERIVVFGSRARGNAGPDSDLDILVIMESDKREVDRIRDVDRLVRRYRLPPYMMPMDILVKTPAEVRERLAMGDQFLGQILVDGKTAYERVVD